MKNQNIPLTEAVRHNINRWFPDRQILIRGPDRFSSMMLSQRRQLVCVLAAGTTLLWAGFASLGMACAVRSAAHSALHERQLAAAITGSQSRIEALTAAYKAAALQRDTAVTQANETRDLAVAQADLVRDRAIEQAKSVVASNNESLGRLALQTQTTIGQVETIIKSTGLSPDRVSQGTPVKAGEDDTAPKEAEAGATAMPQPVILDTSMKMALLWQDIGRLKALGALLAKLPLSAPITQISISSPFGPRADPFTGAPEFHVGVDLRGPVGTPVFATAPGVVSFAGIETGYGNLIEIDHGFGLSTRYSHLQKIFVNVGSTVDLHQEIGLLGNTGWSTGPHLLYETRVDGQPQNPLNFIKVNPNGLQN